MGIPSIRGAGAPSELQRHLSGTTAFPIGDREGWLGVPCLFAIGDVQASRGSGYEGLARLDRPFVEAELVRAVNKLIAPG